MPPGLHASVKPGCNQTVIHGVAQGRGGKRDWDATSSSRLPGKRGGGAASPVNSEKKKAGRAATGLEKQDRKEQLIALVLLRLCGLLTKTIVQNALSQAEVLRRDLDEFV